MQYAVCGVARAAREGSGARGKGQGVDGGAHQFPYPGLRVVLQSTMRSFCTRKCFRERMTEVLRGLLLEGGKAARLTHAAAPDSCGGEVSCWVVQSRRAKQRLLGRGGMGLLLRG